MLILGDSHVGRMFPYGRWLGQHTTDTTTTPGLASMLGSWRDDLVLILRSHSGCGIDGRRGETWMASTSFITAIGRLFVTLSLLLCG